MPNFIITTTDTTSRTLDLNETGLVSGSGTLFTAGFGVAIGNRARLIIDGALHAGGTAIDVAGLASETSIVNTGVISAQLDTIRFTGIAGEYLDVLNTGEILATGVGEAAIATEGDLYVHNSGTIASMGGRGIKTVGSDGLLNIQNSGEIAGNATAIAGGARSDFIENTGLIAGDITLGGGNDTVRLMAGSVTGIIRGGEGGDAYIVGAVEVDLAEGADEGFDQVRSWRDWTLDDNFESLTLVGQARAGRGNDAANLLGGNGADNLLQARAGADDLAGAGGDDQMFGGLGNDTLRGDTGDDSLYGGAGNDSVEGSAGADLLSGGAGADRFLFTAVADSRPDTFDTITDFARGSDRINLSFIDARPGTAPDDAFTFRGAQAFNGLAQVRIVDLGADVRVEVNMVGTSDAEAAILVKGVGSLTASDFVL